MWQWACPPTRAPKIEMFVVEDHDDTTGFLGGLLRDWRHELSTMRGGHGGERRPRGSEVCGCDTQPLSHASRAIQAHTECAGANSDRKSVGRVLRCKGLRPSWLACCRANMLGRGFPPVKARPSSGLSRPCSVPSERRVQFPADELPLDILALLVSCGYAVRADDAQALDHAVRREATKVTTRTFQPQHVNAEASEHASTLVIECRSQSGPALT